jgi:hypothetical protein
MARPKKAKSKTASPAAGYSGKPLIDKLGLKPGASAIVVSPPPNYDALVDGAAIKPAASLPKSGSYDFIHVFLRNTNALESVAPKLEARLADDGMIWISWPKKASPLSEDLAEDGIRAIILPPGKLVDVKVCAVDADWSGLKLLRRKT